MSEEERLPKKENFSEWYLTLVKKILIDQRYPLQGFLTYRPYGYFIIDKYIHLLEEMFEKTGHQKCYFPTLIPQRLLNKETRHLKGFESQVFWVTQYGLNSVDEKCALRPTSETAMYEMIRYWIRSWRDLPLKIHQSCTVFRYETDDTRPLIRDREIIWNEAHTSHETLGEAKEQVKTAIKIYSDLFDRMCIPYVWIDVIEGIFPGAIGAVELYTVFPDGKVLEMGSVNNLGQAFSKPFEVKFKTRDGKDDFAWQTCYGLSERLLAALTVVHGDDKGLIIPPEFAPIQIVIVPILYEQDKDKVLKEAQKIAKELKKYRIKLDDSEMKPGEKFHEWEMKGVPIRIEIGTRDIEKKGVTIYRRDLGIKEFVEFSKIGDRVKFLIKDVYDKMFESGKNYHALKINNAKNIEEIKKNITDEKLSRVNWCGSKECASHIEKTVNAIFIGKGYKEKPTEKCICGDVAKHIGYIGKSY